MGFQPDRPRLPMRSHGSWLGVANHATVCNHYTSHRYTLEKNNMAKRVNFMLDDDSWRVIKKLPRGTRSRAVNAAIREWAGTSRRQDATARMDALRARLPTVRTDRIVRWIREGREQRLP